MKIGLEERFLAKILFSSLVLIFSLLLAYLKPVGFDVDSYSYYLMTINEDVILAEIESNKKKPPKPKSKFQKKLEEMQKQQERKMRKRK